MSVNIEDILLLKAQQDAANREDNGLAAGAGAILGAGAGVVAGEPAHGLGQLGLKVKDRINGTTPSALRGARPGARMAGGLVGALLGGALGPGVKAMAMGESEAAHLLAKLQTGGLTFQEGQQLERVLADAYGSAIGGLIWNYPITRSHKYVFT